METTKSSDSDYNVYLEKCPTRKLLDLIADKWTTLIIGLLEDGPKRFSELQRGIGGISQKMLTQTLRRLERDGLVQRTIYPEVPPRVEYRLTTLGQTLSSPIAAIQEWAETYMEEVLVAQKAYDARFSAPENEKAATAELN
ncbi:MAG: helix-turn-helix transcriptional regulator [Chloroflexi bacterium]|nr:helix-turn-helix transcriptional regulator [Chloroflexota bacterium]